MTIGLHKYLKRTKDWMMELLRKHGNSKNFYSIAKETPKYLRELNIEEQQELNHDLTPRKAAKKKKKKKNETESKVRRKKTGKKNPFHGQYSL